MIDVFDSEAIVKSYRMLYKKCEAIDKFIKNHSLYYGTSVAEYGTIDVINNIIDLMTRKNQLINLKIIVDNAINSLDGKDKRVLYIKMHYHLSMAEFCEFLGIKERTAFRRIERAFFNLTDALNNSCYINKLTNILEKEAWIREIKDEVKERRLSYHTRPTVTV